MSNKIDNCTLDTCPLSESIYTYRPSFAANLAFLILFAISGIAHVAQGIIKKKTSFWIPILIGCIAEILGYLGRILSWHNPFSSNGFLTQIVCLTIAPAFFTAAIYFCLGDIVKIFPSEVSRIKPSTYAKIFIPCDIVSLILQGVGGAGASVKSQRGEDPSTGTHIMVAGLAFQVVSMLLFMVIAGEYLLRVRRWQKMSQVPLPFSKQKGTLFLTFFVLAIITIFIRCIYRVDELSGGWRGTLMHDEPTFIALEGCMVLTAVYSLHIGHPGLLKSRSDGDIPLGSVADDSKPRPDVSVY